MALTHERSTCLPCSPVVFRQSTICLHMCVRKNAASRLRRIRGLPRDGDRSADFGCPSRNARPETLRDHSPGRRVLERIGPTQHSHLRVGRRNGLHGRSSLEVGKDYLVFASEQPSEDVLRDVLPKGTPALTLTACAPTGHRALRNRSSQVPRNGDTSWQGELDQYTCNVEQEDTLRQKRQTFEGAKRQRRWRRRRRQWRRDGELIRTELRIALYVLVSIGHDTVSKMARRSFISLIEDN